MDGKQNLSGKMTRFAFGRRDLSLAHSVNEESTRSFAAANCNNNSTITFINLMNEGVAFSLVLDKCPPSVTNIFS
jgi:hypothetical protein